MILEFLSDPICFTMKSIFECTLILDCDPPTILMKKRLSRKSLAAYLRFSKTGTLHFLSFIIHVEVSKAFLFEFFVHMTNLVCLWMQSCQHKNRTLMNTENSRIPGPRATFRQRQTPGVHALRRKSMGIM